MAMLKAVHDQLIGLLKDAKIKIGEKEAMVTEWIESIYDAAEAKDQVQLANKELTEKRDKLRTDLDAAKKAVDDQTAEIKRLQSGQLSDEDKKKLEAFKSRGMTTEAEAQFNKLQSTVEGLQKQLADSESRIAEREKSAHKARLDGLTERLRSDLLNGLGKAKITGNNATLALNTILAEGMAKVETNDKDEEVRTIHILKDSKPYAASIDELVTHFAGANPALVEPSGNRGAGSDLNRGSPGVKDLDKLPLPAMNREFSHLLDVAAPTKK